MSSLIWDYQIISYLIVCLIAIFIIGSKLKTNWQKQTIHQRNLRLVLEAFFILVFVLIFYGSYIEPRWIKVNQIDLNFNKTTSKETLRIVQISDLHAGAYKKTSFFEKVADQIIALRPDIIVLTGDLILGAEKNALYLKGLEKATEIFPTFAITGNHEYALGRKGDYYNNKMKDKTGPLRQVLEKINIKLLENGGQLINQNNNEFYLIGLQEIWAQPDNYEVELQKLSAGVDPTIPKILLAHNPEVIQSPSTQLIDLILAGHTHGGQIRLPLLGSLAPLPTSIEQSFDRGLFKLPTNNFLYINEGLGEAGPRARLFCRPEISVFNIDL